MKKNATKRALLMSVLSLLLCVSMLVGTTYAWFTDTATSAGNKIQAGTLDINLKMWNGTEYVNISDTKAPIFGAENSLIAQNVNSNTLWEPGKTQVAYLAIENAGSLDLKYQVILDVKNVAKDLFEVMEYAITPDAKNGTGVTAWTDGTAVTVGKQTTTGEGKMYNKGEMHYFALSVHMNEEAGNEYQAGQVEFDINVFATQLASEADSFGTNYDAAATYPVALYSALAVDPANDTVDRYTIPLNNLNGGKNGSAEVAKESVADDAEEISVRVTETDLDSTVTVDTDQGAKTLNIEVEGLKEGNTEPVTIKFNIGKGYSGLVMYHKDQPMAASDYSYNIYDGYLTIKSASFSPFTMVYDEILEEVKAETPEVDEETNLPEGIPVAIVTDADEWENTTIDWTNAGGFYPSNPDQTLETAYQFSAPHTSETVKDCAFKDWYCDYVVKMDRDVEAGALFLGGYYDSFGLWVGFENPETVAANTEVPLLGSVTSGDPEVSGWTYESVVDTVANFICGVSQMDDSLDGATFTVSLRLTNPADTSEYYDVNTVTYTF